MPRIDPAAAERELRAAGATPRAPFPGVHRPWQSVHDECGREISPSLGNVRRRGTVCRYCAAAARGAARKSSVAGAAIARLEARGWVPLEPYPGADKPWRVRHVPCGVEMTRAFNTIRSKGDSCQVCFRAARGHRRWTPDSAAGYFRERGLEPLEAYPGSSTKPWRARHLACGREVAPRLGNLAAGQGPCNLCGLEAGANLRRHDHDLVAEEMRARGYEPLEPFTTVDSPWPSRHLTCGRDVSPSLTNIRRGQGGCLACGREAVSQRFRMPEERARAVMGAHGLTPVEPYPGSARPWRSRHTCGRLVSPTLANVNSGRGICRYCNSAFSYDGQAIVYLIADSEAVKIGCAARDRDRVAEHVRYGWTEAWRVATRTGDDAYALEQAVISWWRTELHAPPHYEGEHMPQYGASETVSWDVTPPSAVLGKLLQLAGSIGVAVSLMSSTEVARDVRPSWASGPLTTYRLSGDKLPVRTHSSKTEMDSLMASARRRHPEFQFVAIGDDE